jgi:hypothetical protein
MPVILIQKDPFTEAEQQIEDEGLYANNFNIRRPLLGMNVKQPRFAFLSLYQDLGDGSQAQAVSIVDSSAPGGYSNANHNFILQSVSETRTEKAQIVETFGDHFVFFYGQKPIILQVRGILFNTEDFNWKNEFLGNYSRFLRGTKCVENKTRVFLGYDDVLAQGYMLNVAVAHDKDMPNVVPVSFSLLLAKPPLDLSNAMAPLDSPNPGAEQPYQYRTYDGVENAYPEYITADLDAYQELQKSDLVSIGVDGKAYVVSGASDEVPGSQEAPEGSAYWVSGTNPGRKQWKDASEALLSLNALLTSQQTGDDVVSVIQQLRRTPEAFQLGSRDDAVLTLLQSLGTGVSNSAAVVADAPILE